MTSASATSGEANLAAGGSRVPAPTDWATLSEADLEQFTIAEWNLVNAVGLDELKSEDVAPLLDRLGTWADLVRNETGQLYDRFRSEPSEYENSEAFFRMVVMATVLQLDLGVRYNLEVMQDPVDCTDSRDWFLHGVLTGHGGTCSSMPVLYVAVGRQLGYPLKLVCAKEHLFARWEDPGGERRNLECAARGLLSFPDEYYLTWPVEMSDEERQRGGYLESLTARQELGLFVSTRANCLMDHMRFSEAAFAADLARQLWPENGNLAGQQRIAEAIRHRVLEEMKREPTGKHVARIAELTERQPDTGDRQTDAVASRELQRIVTVRTQRGLPVPRHVVAAAGENSSSLPAKPSTPSSAVAAENDRQQPFT